MATDNLPLQSSFPPAIPPLSSPLRSTLTQHPKRGLLPILSHIPRHPRSASQERAFQERKAEILRTMTAAQIEARYQETVVEIRRLLEESQAQMEQWEREMQGVKDQRELERRLWKTLREQKEGSEG